MCERYLGLAFSFADMLREIEYMRQATSKFITARTKEAIIPDWRRILHEFQMNPGNGTCNWAIPEEDPIVTIWNEGQSEEDGHGPNLCGKLSCIWTIRIENPYGKKADRAQFVLDGLASTAISIVQKDGNQEQEAAKWHFDVGNADSPGCHFHVQVTASNADARPIELSVPRLPSYAITPMDALEFLLSELFQQRWGEYSSYETKEILDWSPYQRRRLSCLLKWQHELIATKTIGTPWTALKKAKPSRYTLTPELHP